MKISVKDLRPNPFRDMKRYPINAAKVEALKASIKATDFWDNIVVRRAPDGDGFQMAYGHHRLEALKALKIESVDLPVRELDDATMLRMLANENMEEWGVNAAVMQETVRAVVLAYAKGSIELDAVPAKVSKDRIRYAPSFIIGMVSGTGDHPYTAESVADFLQWRPQKVAPFLSFLELEESNVVSANAIIGLNASAVEEIAKNVKPYVANEKIAKNVVAGLVADFKSNELSTSSAGREKVRATAASLAAAAGFKESNEKKKKALKLPPNQNEAAKTVAYSIEKETPLHRKVQALVEVAEHLNGTARRVLANCCLNEADRWTAFAKQIEKAGSRA